VIVSLAASIPSVTVNENGDHTSATLAP
jgi:hypothetical protein